MKNEKWVGYCEVCTGYPRVARCWSRSFGSGAESPIVSKSVCLEPVAMRTHS
jgi:hypothetical protein